MKRTALKRRTPLRSTAKLRTRTRLQAKTPIAKVNRKRKAKTYARNYGKRGEAVRSMPCAARPCGQPSVAAHVIARGMGGAKGDRRKLVPLCQGHHVEAGEFRTSARARFEAKYGIDLLAIADRIAVDLDRRGIP